MVPQGCLLFVIVVFPDHTHLLFFSFPCPYDVKGKASWPLPGYTHAMSVTKC